MADRFPERHITGCATEELKQGAFRHGVQGPNGALPPMAC